MVIVILIIDFVRKRKNEWMYRLCDLEVEY